MNRTEILKSNAAHSYVKTAHPKADAIAVVGAVVFVDLPLTRENLDMYANHLVAHAAYIAARQAAARR